MDRCVLQNAEVLVVIGRSSHLASDARHISQAERSEFTSIGYSILVEERTAIWLALRIQIKHAVGVWIGRLCPDRIEMSRVIRRALEVRTGRAIKANLVLEAGNTRCATEGEGLSGHVTLHSAKLPSSSHVAGNAMV